MNELSHSMFMPHGMCFLWTPHILWTHVVSDLIIGLSYLSIPAVLAIFTLKRPDLVYRPVVWLFVAFIISCGITHVFSIWTMWTPDYGIQGFLKAITAVASVATAVILWPILPRLLAIPSSEDLKASNIALQEEVQTRLEAERELSSMAQDLENRVTQRTKDLSRSNEALESFAATVSHDLQAPLRHISMFSQLLVQDEKDSLSEQGGLYLDKIQGSVERMQTLIQVILEYARLSQDPPSPELIDLNLIIDDVNSQFSRDYPDASLTIKTKDLPELWVDRILITQVFSNLTSNAMKYSEREHTLIHIEYDPVGEKNGFVTIKFRDNGVGIEPQFAERIFEMLKRLSNHDQGTGVGLAFCKQIVESHGGKIWLDTNYKEGAQFCMTLPQIEQPSKS